MVCECEVQRWLRKKYVRVDLTSQWYRLEKTQLKDLKVLSEGLALADFAAAPTKWSMTSSPLQLFPKQNK